MINLTEGFEPVAVIDVKKLKNNLDSIISIKKSAQFFAVVKSDAYGHGLKTAEFINDYCRDNCSGFCVSKIEEGQTLRHLGINKTIMTLSPVSGYALNVASSYNLTVPCYDLKSAKEITELSKSKFVLVNMVVDSGMRRLGFDNACDFERVVKAFSQNKNVRLVSVYSHFACCSDDELNKKQLNEFFCYEKIFKKYSDGFSHVSASGGLLKGITLDAVRVGILIYGYTPFENPINVEPIMNITAKPSVIKTFSKNVRCLYNSEIESGVYGLVNYGYADGMSRKNTPTRCMDLSYEKLISGDLCIVLGDAQKQAEKLGTIPYEILVNCATRLKKIYINEL